MPEKQKPNSFLDSLKSFLSSDKKMEEKEERPASKEEDSVLKDIAVNTISPIKEEEKEKVIAFKGISTAEDVAVRFAENFIDSKGKFIFCENEQECFQLLESLKAKMEWDFIGTLDHKVKHLMQKHQFQTEQEAVELRSADAGMSFCYNLSANEGVIILSPQQATNRRLFTFPPHHIIIAYKNQLKEDIENALIGFKAQYNDRLASVLELYEEKPVAKAHHKDLLSADGTKSVFLFYIDQEIELA